MLPGLPSTIPAAAIAVWIAKKGKTEEKRRRAFQVAGILDGQTDCGWVAGLMFARARIVVKGPSTSKFTTPSPACLNERPVNP